jgi:hypothetical protein
MKIQLVVISVITVSLISSRACAQYDPNHFDPDNAAHWYRKAFDLYDEPNDFDLDEYIHYRIKLSLEIDHYLKQQKPVVKLLARAALIENYDWEFYPSPGNFTPSYLSDARDCAVLLLADARYAIDNEDPTIFSERIDHCLTLSLRIDRGDTLSFLTSAGMRSRTYAFIREYLNNHPDCSLEHLQAVKGLLLNNGNRHYNSYRDLLDYEAQRAHIILGNQDSNLLISIPLWESLLNPAENTIQQDFYKRNYDFYEKYITQLKQASEQPYSEAVESIKEIEEELKQKWRDCYKRFQGIPEGY